MTDFFYIDEIANLIHSEKKLGLIYKKSIIGKGIFTAKDGENNVWNNEATVRFSKVFGKEGESDTVRDVQAMFVKFHGRGKEWDILSHNIDVYDEIKNPEKLLKLIKAFQEDRKSIVEEHKSIWELVAADPSFVPFALNYFSDRGTRKSFFTSAYYGINEYKDIADNSIQETKFRWMPLWGDKCISDREAEFLAGFDGNIAMRDMKETLERGEIPEFELIRTDSYSEGNLETVLGILEINKLCSINKEWGFLPANCPPDLKLKEDLFNRFTAFAFAEGLRWRGEKGI